MVAGWLKALGLLALGGFVGGCALLGSPEVHVDFWEPVMCPDGERLAYAARGGSGYDLFILDVATGEERLLVQHERDAISPSWSPDGTHVAYATMLEKDNWDILTVEVATGSVFRVTTEPSVDVNPHWTTTGSIVFNSDRDGEWAAYAVEPDGTDVRRLSPERPESD